MDWSLESKLELLGNALSGAEFYAGPARWLRNELVSTAAARDRLRAWAVAGGLRRPERCGTSLRFCGDRTVNVAAILALNMLAPPARDYVLDKTVVVGSGDETHGFAARFPAAPSANEARLVVLTCGSPEGNPVLTEIAVRVALHEFAHVWLEPAETFDEPPNSTEREERLRLRSAGGPILYTRHQSAMELRAWALAEAWRGEPFGGGFWLEIRKHLTL
jgi:hypothetical protein